MLLFDEVEAVLNPTGVFFGSDNKHKAWLNQFLDGARLPCVWIANDIAGVDPAYLRRFDLMVHLPTPPRSVRRLMAHRALADFGLDHGLLDRIAMQSSITPAELARTRSALAMTGPGTNIDDTAAIVLTNGGCELPLGALKAPTGYRLPPFDIDCIHSDLDVRRVVAQLRHTDGATLCFHGPPGTGKTALAHHMAEQLDRELVTIQASDWLSPWVGATEQAIRASFARAEKTGAVLLVDEADTFLCDRAMATRSWETSRVNELLKCLENVRSVAIFATNAFQTLDPAVLRRLDIKAAFMPMRRAQCRRLFAATLSDNGCDAHISSSADTRLERLTDVTGGDFSTALRRLWVAGVDLNADTLINALSQELDVRAQNRGDLRIGFLD